MMHHALRRHPRVRFRAAVRMSSTELHELAEGTAVNLSEGGLYVHTREVLRVGAAVVCELTLEGQRVLVPGEVAWTRGETLCEEESRRSEEREEGGAQHGAAAGDASEDASAVTQQEVTLHQSNRRRRNDTETLIVLGGASRPGQTKSKSVADTPREQKAAEAFDARGERDSGMGIRFRDVAEAHAELIRQQVESGEAEAARGELWFHGLRQPVRARVFAHAGGIRLRTRLPFLELGSNVRFGFTPGAEPPYRGRVQSVTLRGSYEDRVPSLTIDVGSADGDATGLDAALSGTAGDAPPDAEESDLAPREPVVPIRLRERAAPPSTLIATKKGYGFGALLLVGLVGLALGAAAAVLGGLDQTVPGAFARATWTRFTSRSATDGNANAAAQPTRPRISTPHSAVTALPASGVSDSEASTRAPTTVSDDLLSFDAPPRDALDDPVDAASPVVTATDSGTSVFVPMQGSGEEMQVYELSSPGVAVSLPQATTPIPLDNYGIYAGVVTRVWLRPLEEGGTQVRVLFRRKRVQYQVLYDDRGLTLALR